MKLATNQISARTQGIVEEMSFSLNKEGLPVILNILRNQLYSNKPLAIIRELSTNAFDAHKESGKETTPIAVHLPNSLDPHLRIRDYGKAMSRDQIRSIFVEYGASTKRDSNDYIGQMGIGAKSPFCYVDNFVISSFQGGKKTVYNAFIDPSQVGKMVVFGEYDTDEPDGLEIQVNVKESDFHLFVTAAASFFQFWKVRPTITGAQINYNTYKLLKSGNKWEIYTDDNNRGSFYRHSSVTPKCIMGNITYSLDANAIDFTGNDNLRPLLQFGLFLYVDIGTVEVSASRESLQYTKFTQKTIIESLIKVRDELIAEFNKKMNNSASFYEAKLTYFELFDYSSPLQHLKPIIGKSITYKGKIVDCDYWAFDTDEAGGQISQYYMNPGRKRAKISNSLTINCHSNIVLVIDFKGIESGLSQRIVPLLFDDKILGKTYTKVIFIRVEDKTKWDKWVKDNDFDYPYHELKDLPKRNLSDFYGKRQNTGYSGLTEKGMSHVLLANDAKHPRLWRNIWEPTEFKLDDDNDFDEDDCYVLVEAYKPVDDGLGLWNDDVYSWATFIETCKSLDILPANIYGIKSHIAKKHGLPDGLKTLKEAVLTKTNQVFPQSKLQEMVDSQFANDNKFNYLRNLLSYLPDGIEELKILKEPAKFNNINFLKSLNVKFPAVSGEMEKKRKLLMDWIDEHPLLSFVNIPYSYNSNYSDFKKALKKYLDI